MNATYTHTEREMRQWSTSFLASLDCFYTTSLMLGKKEKKRLSLVHSFAPFEEKKSIIIVILACLVHAARLQ
jgi:hypothetical protein